MPHEGQATLMLTQNRCLDHAGLSPEDLDEIVEKYRGMLVAIGHQFRLTPEEREDATQSTWPGFDENDLRESRTSRPSPDGRGSADPPLPDEQWWVLFVKEDDDGFEHIRLDLLRTDDVANNTAITPVQIRLDDGDPIDIGAPVPLPWTNDEPDDYVWPIIDRSSDSILLSLKRGAAEPLQTVEISTGRGPAADTHAVSLDPSDVDQDFGFRPTALILLQYCIQGFNDLFASPIAAYRPPRNYIEVTFADEAAAYSSRPGFRENHIPDGYRYALEAQRDYQVKTQWAFNAGVLMLLRYGLPAEQFALLTDQVTSGLISPSNAGFGAHRPPYYQHYSNQRELILGDQVIESSLGRASDRTYYPDQRIYLATPSEVATYSTLLERDQLRYLVLDRSTVAGQVGGTDVWLFGEGHSTGDDGNYLWKEAATGLTVLLIEDQLRNEMLNAGPDETLKGQLGYWLRRRLMLAVRFRKPGPSKSAELLGPPSISHPTERVRRSPQGERGLEQRDDLGIPFFLSEGERLVNRSIEPAGIDGVVVDLQPVATGA
jgi:hypothetical protein